MRETKISRVYIQFWWQEVFIKILIQVTWVILREYRNLVRKTRDQPGLQPQRVPSVGSLLAIVSFSPSLPRISLLYCTVSTFWWILLHVVFYYTLTATILSFPSHLLIWILMWIATGSDPLKHEQSKSTVTFWKNILKLTVCNLEILNQNIQIETSRCDSVMMWYVAKWLLSHIAAWRCYRIL